MCFPGGACDDGGWDPLAKLDEIGKPTDNQAQIAVMKGLGHERVRVLDETAEDWTASGLAITKDARILPRKTYSPAETANYTATYDFVKSGQAQIVDARTLEEYGTGSIPGSISIPYTSVLSGKEIKSEDRLNKVFMMLDRDKPVVVFTNTGMKASVGWFALEMMGYDARLYNYRDWVANQELRGDSVH